VAVRAVQLPGRPGLPPDRRAAVAPLPAVTIRRERLERRLDARSPRDVTVVTGPPGAGKTVLLAAWARGRDVAWVSLRPEHVDVAALWRDLAAALRPAGVHLGEPVRAAGSIPDGADARVRPAVAAAAGRATLVLDDLHLLRGPALSVVASLAAECADEVRLVVASRSDPDLPLGRLRLEDRLGEVRAGDLAFTVPEAAQLLTASGLELRDDQVERLVERTEGWAAGLRLAALSLRSEPDADRFIADFAGDDRAVADYLSGEVLAAQAPDVREFLLRTSIADHLCGSLADALTGAGGGARALDEMHHAGLFLLPVDRRRTWFRYHPLFAELLRARLRVERPGLEPELHTTAARWLAENGLGRDALAHALRSDDAPAMADLLAEQWLNLLLGGVAPRSVLDVARSRPDDPRLAAAAAGACLDAGDARCAEAVLAGAGATADRDGAASVAVLLRARARSDVAGARAAATQIVGHGDSGPLAVPVDDARRSLALLHLGITEFEAGSLAAAADSLDAASALAVDARRERVLLECLGRTAALEVLDGRLTRADAAAAGARALAGPAGWERTAASAWAYAAAATVHWLRDEVEEAEASADAAMAAADAGAEVPAAHVVRLLRAHLAVARGDVERGRAMLRTVLEGSAGDRPVVRGWLDALGPRPWAVDESDDADPLATAAVRLGRGDALSALRRVEPLLDRRAAEHPTRRLHAWLVAAVARQALGHSADAAEAIERALEIAAPEGYRRPFADGGGAVRRLLQRHTSLPTAYAPLVAELIDVLERGFGPPPGLVEPLSDRERDVLRLLPTLLANTEIASELFVSVNTVKTHVKSIYRKLEVSSRREAVARARDLRLI
jgi:LuxR family transcriptional regulator, maltose regulon positive regulatory protein